MESPKNNETKENEKKTTAKGNISTKDANLFTQAENANNTWKLNPDFTLRWITQPDFDTFLKNAKENFLDRKLEGSKRQAITSNLVKADEDINEAVKVVKGYIIKKYETEKNAIPYYANFGLVYKNKTYNLPKDREDRLTSLSLMEKAITMEGFGNEKYGTSFWKDTFTKYNDLVKLASETDGTVSAKVGDKNKQIIQIKKVLNALIGLVKSNFPDTYKTELRNWGVQKEKF